MFVIENGLCVEPLDLEAQAVGRARQRPVVIVDDDSDLAKRHFAICEKIYREAEERDLVPRPMRTVSHPPLVADNANSLEGINFATDGEDENERRQISYNGDLGTTFAGAAETLRSWRLIDASLLNEPKELNATTNYLNVDVDELPDLSDSLEEID